MAMPAMRAARCRPPARRSSAEARIRRMPPPLRGVRRGRKNRLRRGSPARRPLRPGDARHPNRMVEKSTNRRGPPRMPKSDPPGWPFPPPAPRRIGSADSWGPRRWRRSTAGLPQRHDGALAMESRSSIRRMTSRAPPARRHCGRKAPESSRAGRNRPPSGGGGFGAAMATFLDRSGHTFRKSSIR